MTISRERKVEYFKKLEYYLDTYTRVFIISADNVGSNQMQQIRISLRNRAEVLMGKNTLMRKGFTSYIEKHPGHPFEVVLSHIRGNIGFVFTNADLNEIRTVITSNRVPAPARVGSIAPCDVLCPKGPTGCDPGQTSFFQALSISTKIQKGQIEIVSDVLLTKQGEKVGNSEAALLQKLNIRPFSYGLVITHVYDNGSLFDPKVLDLKESDLIAKFLTGLQNIASVSLALSFPTIASIPHSLNNAFKNMLSIAVECTEFSFKQAEAYKAFLADPSAFAAVSAQNDPSSADGGGEEQSKEEVKEEEEEEADLGGGMDMFGGDDEDY